MTVFLCPRCLGGIKHEIKINNRNSTKSIYPFYEYITCETCNFKYFTYLRRIAKRNQEYINFLVRRLFYV